MGVTALGTAAIAAREAIVRLCANDLPPLDLLDQVARRVRRVVPYAAAGWLTIDPATLLPTGVVSEQVPPILHKALIENEIAGDDFARFADIARLPRPVLPLSEATAGDLARSVRHRELYAPAGYGDELRAAFRSGGACWGVACLTRADDDPPFTPVEIEFVTDICDHVAHGLRTGLLLKAVENVEAEGDSAGIVVLEGDGAVESLGGDAERWLSELPTDDLGLPSVIHAVAGRARAHAGGHTYGPPARARVRLPSGRWLLVHGARLNAPTAADARTAVVLEPARRADLAPLIVDLYELTERERDVTQLLVGGRPIDEIATTLGISQHTVRDHTKAIFAKCAVKSRPELTAMLFHEHFLPDLLRGAAP